MTKKILILLVIAGLLGGVLGSIISANSAQAGFFDSALNFLKNGYRFGNTTTTTGRIAKQKAPIELYKPVIDYEEAVTSAVDAAAPSVVSIVISKDVPIIEDCPYDPFSGIPPEFKDFFNNGFEFSQPCEKGTERKDVGGGSGFIVSIDGLVVTNKHVISDPKADYTVFTNDGKKYTAKVIATDPIQDLAIIKIDAINLMPAKLGNSDGLKLGQTSIAIGNALGEFRNTVSVGVISGLSRSITASGQGIGSESLSGVIQTDAAINPGNSGGPLLDLKGEVIGINTAVASGAQSIGFAIPINSVKRSIISVQRTGEIKSSYLGVRYLLIDADVAKKQNLPVEYGALVRGTKDGPGVIVNSPADKAGILAEDIITEINGEKITHDMPLAILTQKYNVGDTVVVTVYRGKEVKKFQVILGERPKQL